jgi:hypothetical protein
MDPVTDRETRDLVVHLAKGLLIAQADIAAIEAILIEKGVASLEDVAAAKRQARQKARDEAEKQRAWAVLLLETEPEATQ